MTTADTQLWLEQNEQQILDRWLDAIDAQGLWRLCPSGSREQLREQLDPMFRAVARALQEQGPLAAADLTDLVRRSLQRATEPPDGANGGRDRSGRSSDAARAAGTQPTDRPAASLTDLLRVAFALRTAVGEALLESGDAEQAVAIWHVLCFRFDHLAEALSESYTQVLAAQSSDLYQEIRALNRSLEAVVDSRTKELAEEKERIETLYAIGRELSTSLDLNQVLEKTLLLVTKAVGARYGSIMLLDRSSGNLVYRARLGGRSPLPADGKPTPFRPGLGVAGWVLESHEPALIGDVLQDERWVFFPGKGTLTRSLMAAPLMVGKDIHGVLLIADGMPSAFSESQFRMVVACAQLVAQTISNAQLYECVLESAERLGRLLRTEQAQRSKSQAILQSIADGVIMSDTQHKVIVLNAAAAGVLGLEGKEVLGRDARELFHAFGESGRGDAMAAQELLVKSPTVSAGQVIEMVLENRNKVISARMAPVLTETGESLGVVTALRDITREVDADRAKSEFVSTVSHELRTPLTSIKGYTDLLHARAVGTINEEQERFLSIIKKNADRLTALINDLLDMSRIETGRVKLQIEPVNLADVIREVAELLREQIEGKKLRLELDLSDEVPEVKGDRTRLVQIVTNLVSNAFKYTDAGWIRIALGMVEGVVRLDVADSGIGISMEDQGRIFERFYRVDAPVMAGRGGTGLGLAITKQLVELHGGRVWVKSEPGAGSTFTAVFPVAAQGLPQCLVGELPEGTKKILVVDDERDIVALLRHHLATRGYHVMTASTGAQAISRAIQEQPDLITLDLLLPDRHGLEVLRELKSRTETARIPVIILSVVQDESLGYRLGAIDYIVKPLDEHQLLGSVTRALNHKGKILVAEDSPDMADFLLEILRKHGYEPLVALDGYQALTLARCEQPELILLDLRTSGTSGYEALTRLKRDSQTNQIPILVMSTHDADVLQERPKVRAMGAEDFISKPFSIEKLLEEIGRITLNENRQAI